MKIWVVTKCDGDGGESFVAAFTDAQEAAAAVLIEDGSFDDYYPYSIDEVILFENVEQYITTPATEGGGLRVPASPQDPAKTTPVEDADGNLLDFAQWRKLVNAKRKAAGGEEPTP